MEFIFIFHIIAILFSMVFHEIGHGYAALRLGDHTARLQGRLSLNPISHIDPVFTIIIPCTLIFIGLPPIGGAKPVPVNPNFFKNVSPRRGMLLVAAAGPLVNLILCMISLVILHATHLILPSFITLFFVLFISYNTLFFVFNLIPLPPLDGSKILIGLLPKKLAFKWLKFEKYGLLIVFALAILGVFWPFIEACLQFSDSLLPSNLFESN